MPITLPKTSPKQQFILLPPKNIQEILLLVANII